MSRYPKPVVATKSRAPAILQEMVRSVTLFAGRSM
jgi:hypothetical protein